MTICFGVAIVVVAVLLLNWATRPLRDLAVAAERFSLDQTPQPLDEAGPAEVRRAARAFNTMRERIQRLVSERMQALAAVSHDLRTPITRLRLRSELMDHAATRDLVDADFAEMEGMIDNVVGNATNTSRKRSSPATRASSMAFLRDMCRPRISAGC